MNEDDVQQKKKHYFYIKHLEDNERKTKKHIKLHSTKDYFENDLSFLQPIFYIDRLIS